MDLTDWQGQKSNKNSGKPSAHPNSRFTVSIYNCPTLSPEYDNPKGAPISVIIFGGRRKKYPSQSPQKKKHPFP
ncbi:MAG: phosphoenolpyruvate carboxykinase (GTP) [Endomicrobium sp.]|nr:phosphoenolpyruvate carboxykinase (GTP) [Endomicrobium sp.]